jgi:hypothetical protein
MQLITLSFLSQYQKCIPLLVQSQTEIKESSVRREMLAELKNLTHRWELVAKMASLCSMGIQTWRHLLLFSLVCSYVPLPWIVGRLTLFRRMSVFNWHTKNDPTVVCWHMIDKFFLTFLWLFVYHMSLLGPVAMTRHYWTLYQASAAIWHI